MELEKQIDEIVRYIERGEKDKKDFKLGVEFEHFIVDKQSLRTVTYYEDKGVKHTLRQLIKKGWNGIYEGEYLLGLEKDNASITLEPGAQLEISIKPYKNIEEIERVYLNFLEDLIPILDSKNQILLSLGYQPKTKIANIPFIPKERYKYMSKYLQKRGKYALNMMKGTASTQVTIDYKSEKDYIKKFRIANSLSPVISAIFDNTPFFEGEVSKKYNIRTLIWNNCDDDRCGIVEGALDNDFGYKKYAQYILNRPPIIIKKDNDFLYTKGKRFKYIFNISNNKENELSHVLTMFFPDVRTKKFIEIRMADSIPYPLNFSIIAFWKGLLYNEDNLNILDEYLNDIDISAVLKAKKDIINYGINTLFKGIPIYELGKKILQISKKGLCKEERDYLNPLEEILINKITPTLKTKQMIARGKYDALDWCNLNNVIKCKI
ncbi:glutamate--cysteine ligase [Thermohalobacter berrensis]|uniref:Glutamate--cysteine ligase n=1 Tax=Thermohalobacter berrensis TaxID=99594 RepID=A0A419TBF1_9FIRM|nr:glutamate--cysteine ligase [Thermohalobacter berrensis]